MNTSDARRMRALTEPIAGHVYFSDEAREEWAAAGVDPVAGYFCGRAAPMGQAAAAVVAAAFYNFNPALFERMLRWDVVTPEAALAVRARAVARGLARLLDRDGTSSDVIEAAALLRRAAEACRPEGRPLFAANAALPWPDDPLEALWHGANLVREHRGDGHVAVLIAHGVDAVEALVLHHRYAEMRHDAMLRLRAWPDEAYEAARDRLRARGFLDADAEITAGGMKFRDMLELETDKLSMAPVHALGEAAFLQLNRLLEPLAARIVEQRGIPRYAAAAAGSPGRQP